MVKYYLGLNKLPKKIVEKCISVYEENDLFVVMDNNYERLKNDLLSQKNIRSTDLINFIHTTRGSKYTDFYTGYYYKQFHKSKPVIDDVKFKHFAYISFKKFGFDDCKRVIELLEFYKGKPFLILDLRDNYGGSIDGCAMICNKLLDECEIFTLKYKYKTITYLSDKHYINYKHIYILLNENSASSSECLALALKLKKNNVTLVGNGSAQKSIGQTSYANKKYRYVFSITSFKWEVDGENTAKLQEYINNDSGKNHVFKKDEDYFQFILNQTDYINRM
jgi:hypothetical protein